MSKADSSREIREVIDGLKDLIIDRKAFVQEKGGARRIAMANITVKRIRRDVRQTVYGDFTIEETIDGLRFLADLLAAINREPEAEGFDLSEYTPAHGTDLETLQGFVFGYSYAWNRKRSVSVEGTFFGSFISQSSADGKTGRAIRIEHSDNENAFYRNECTIGEMCEKQNENVKKFIFPGK